MAEASSTPLSQMSAIVVNFNSGDALLNCVASLRSGGLKEIVVVDNASSDGSLARLAEADRQVVLVPSGSNLGFGRAVNLGATRCEGELLLVCNPDLVVDAAAPALLAERLADEADLAVVGPKVLQPDGTRYPSARSFPSVVDAAGHAVIGLVYPDNPFTRRYQMVDAGLAGGCDVGWVSGACMAVRRTAFASVDGFDESYFMYVEDLDLCWRLHRAGWRVAYEPEAVVTHIGGVSARHHPYAMLAAHHRSTWRFANKSTDGPKRLLLPVVAGGLAGRFVVASGLELLKDLRDRRNGRPGAVE